MAEHSTQTNEELIVQKRRSGGLGTVLLLLLALAAVAYAAQLWLQKGSLTDDIDTLEQRIENTSASIEGLRSKANISDQLVAADILGNVLATRVPWSDLVNLLEQFQNEEVQFTNFSTSRGNELFITGLAPDYQAVSELLSQIQDNPRTAQTFIESAVETRNTSNARGRDLTVAAPEGVQFQLVFKYQPPAPDANPTEQ